MNLKKVIPFSWKYDFKLFLNKYKKNNHFDHILLENKPKAFIFLAADYGNLGDVAITYAQTEFIKNNSSYQVIEIPISQSINGLWWVKSIIQEHDVVTIVGGGNMGELYAQIEHIRQLVIRFFPNNKIISFPQTFDFSTNYAGTKALKKALCIYNSHKNLIIVAREQISYDLIKKNFKNAKILLTPDIVLSQNKVKPIQNRNGAVLCLRQDDEKMISQNFQNILINKVKEKFKNNVKEYDTHINRNNLNIEERNKELNKIWQCFRESDLVITDRLHGMIFCYITQTPCIVLPNNNHKIKGTLEWFKEVDYIKFMENEDIEEIEDMLQNYSFSESKYQSLEQDYKKLLLEL